MSQVSPPPTANHAAETPPAASAQFSIRFAMAVTGVAAVAFAVLFALPQLLATVCLLVSVFLIPCVALVTTIYGRGYSRAFAIGASIPAFPLVFWMTWLVIEGLASSSYRFDLIEDSLSDGLRIVVGGSWAFEIVCGLIGVLARATSDKSVR